MCDAAIFIKPKDMAIWAVRWKYWWDASTALPTWYKHRDKHNTMLEMKMYGMHLAAMLVLVEKTKQIIHFKTNAYGTSTVSLGFLFLQLLE